jgi:hypothetical protein
VTDGETDGTQGVVLKCNAGMASAACEIPPNASIVERQVFGFRAPANFARLFRPETAIDSAIVRA